MSLRTRVSGVWKNTLPHVRVSGVWRDVPQVYVRDSGAWKPLYSFTWENGAWGECSASCGGGTQTRTVRAKRSDGQYFNDTIGTKFAGEKPDTSQACNTQACTVTECQYVTSFDEISALKGGITRYKGYDEYGEEKLPNFGEEWRWVQDWPDDSYAFEVSRTLWGNIYANNNQTTEMVVYGGCTYTRGTQRLEWGQYTDVEGYLGWWAFWEICRECPA